MPINFKGGLLVNGENVTTETEVEALQEELDNKADVDGNYPTLTSGLSLLTKNVEAKTKIEDNEPYAVRVVPSGVAEDCLVNGVVGVDVVKNQLIPTAMMHASTTLSESSSSNHWGESVGYVNGISSKIGHKFFAYVKTTNPSYVKLAWGSHGNNFVNGGSGVTYPTQQFDIYEPDEYIVGTGVRSEIAWFIRNGAPAGTYEADIFLIDLTQRYGSNEVVNAIIGSDTSTQVAKLLAFDPDILKNTENDTGTLINVQVNGRKVTNANVWDEEWELGTIALDYGQNNISSTDWRSKGFIKVRPNTQYHVHIGGIATTFVPFFYDASKNYISGQFYNVPANEKDFTTPNNAQYVRFVMYQASTHYGLTYNHDITINPSSPLINGTYISHKDNTYPIQPIDLHGVFKVENGKVVANGDYYPYTGQGKRRFGTYTFTGNEAWVWSSSYNFWYKDSLLPDNAKSINQGQNICNNGIVLKIISDGRTIRIYPTDNPQITSSTNMNNVFPSGTTMSYELATETDFEATPFTHIQKSYLDGTEEWLSPTNHINPPIPHETSYLPDLADKLELAPNNPNADGTYVVTRANGVNTYTSLGSWLTNNDYKQAKDLPTIEALGGTLRQLLAISQNVDFLNTDFVDLDSLSWTYSNDGYFYTNLLNCAGASYNNVFKALSTKYVAGSVVNIRDGSTNGIACLDSTHALYVRNGSSTEKPSGLLAYEKA